MRTPYATRWPMIVLETHKGWTGPKVVEGQAVEGTWRAHQVPIADFKDPEHLQQLEARIQRYRPEKVFDDIGKFREDYATLAPIGGRRMGSNPVARCHCPQRRFHELPTVRGLPRPRRTACRLCMKCRRPMPNACCPR
jgi:phosphoketolase